MVSKPKSVQEVQEASVPSGQRLWKVLDSKFCLPQHYDVIDPIGSGAYGVVVAAKDTREENGENNHIAIKKIEKAFEHKVFTLRTLRELKI